MAIARFTFRIASFNQITEEKHHRRIKRISGIHFLLSVPYLMPDSFDLPLFLAIFVIVGKSGIETMNMTRMTLQKK